VPKKPESRRQRKVREAIEDRYPGRVFIYKSWGGPFQRTGLPDLIGHLDGLFFAFEVKMEWGETSEIQDDTIAEMNETGGFARVVERPAQALAFLKQLLQERKTWGSGGTNSTQSKLKQRSSSSSSTGQPPYSRSKEREKRLLRLRSSKSSDRRRSLS
jgi:hypothetical protein